MKTFALGQIMFIFQIDHHREAGKVAVGEILTLYERRIKGKP